MTNRSWSEIPNHLILDRLLGKDVARYRSVCTKWRSVSSTPIESSTFSETFRLPLLVSFGDDNSIFNINSPLYNLAPTMSISEIAGAKIRSSNFGWLLMSKGKYAMFFFNPFTKEKIDLPNLPCVYKFDGIGFSSPPTSSECVILAIFRGTIRITEYCFIRHGEDTWNVLEGDNHYPFTASYNNPVFHEGVFYVLGIKGNLGIFDPNKEEEECWTVITSPNAEPCISIRVSYFAKCNNDIVTICEGSVGKWVKIFKFDSSKKVWRKQSSLGNNSLFLSSTSSFATTNEATKALGMENKIYTPRFYKENGNGVFYSPITCMFHSFWGDFARADCYNTTENRSCTWIEPNFEVHSKKELKWNSPPEENDEELESWEDDVEILERLKDDNDQLKLLWASVLSIKN